MAVQLVGSVHQQCSKAGVAFIAGLTDLTLQLADGSPVAAAAVAGQQLDACLQFFTLLTAGPASQLHVAVLLACPRLLPLASACRSSTRRLVLDLCSNLLPAAARLVPNSERQVAAGCSAAERAMGDGAVQECKKGEAAPVSVSAPPLPPSLPVTAAPSLQSLLLAALLGRLGDRNATLRAKVLGCLERHVQLVAAHLSSNNEGRDVALTCLLPAMCARWADDRLCVFVHVHSPCFCCLDETCDTGQLVSSAIGSLSKKPVQAFELLMRAYTTVRRSSSRSLLTLQAVRQEPQRAQESGCLAGGPPGGRAGAAGCCSAG